ncbi:MAG: GNAT family N-acetyltransferase [Polyangiaceae bacterium]|nr:GNAT family N-acetyltransferase [Polyangiaceae bacterium]MCW5790537.1 GNAT family N-acetyltransferase [Polyangiaceae bacterium]
MSVPAPAKLRVSGLQEAHVDSVLAIDTVVKTEHQSHGADAAPLTLKELAQLPRKHNVRVAEADDVPVGFGAWRDEEPGVGVVEELSVLPPYREHGVAEALLDKFREEARAAGIQHLVVRAWEASPSSKDAFLALHFRPLPAELPDTLARWLELTEAAGPVTLPGQVLLHALVN